MVCCMIIADLLVFLMRPFLALRASPLTWRPDTAVASRAPTRATGRLQSFVHAFAGLAFLVRNEPNMRIHLGVAAMTMLAGAWLGISPGEWRWLALAIALVLVTEGLNTAVEQACNAITRTHDPAIKAAKDVAAGAVLIAAFAAAIIGASIFVSHLLGKAPIPTQVLPSSLCGSNR